MSKKFIIHRDGIPHGEYVPFKELVILKGGEYYFSVSHTLTKERSEAVVLHPDVAGSFLLHLYSNWKHLRFRAEPADEVNYESSKRAVG